VAIADTNRRSEVEILETPPLAGDRCYLEVAAGETFPGVQASCRSTGFEPHCSVVNRDGVGHGLNAFPRWIAVQLTDGYGFTLTLAPYDATEKAPGIRKRAKNAGSGASHGTVD
jgi:hypothetical protein